MQELNMTCVGYKNQECQNDAMPHPSGLCVECYKEYKQDLRDGNVAGGEQ